MPPRRPPGWLPIALLAAVAAGIALGVWLTAFVSGTL